MDAAPQQTIGEKCGLVVVDQELVTSRMPDDIPAFNRRMVEVFSQQSRPRDNRRIA